MKIKELFDELEKIKETSKSDFEISGMINRFNEMQYGFFPLGLGILTENNKIKNGHPNDEIEKGGIMVLGNDFGTETYVNNYLNNPEKRVGETDSKTINNLLSEKVGLNLNKTFFTNFYLGVRTHPNASMTKRVEKLQDSYKKICYEFFFTQINLLNPSIIICLGHDVKNALAELEASFEKWKPKSISLKKIHDEENHIIKNTAFGNRKFVVIPHPCDLRNFNEAHMIKLSGILNKK
jgi:hypothetical protein